VSEPKRQSKVIALNHNETFRCTAHPACHAMASWGVFFDATHRGARRTIFKRYCLGHARVFAKVHKAEVKGKL